MSGRPSGGGIPAPPNRCHIKGRILTRQQDVNFPDKWLCRVEIIASTDEEGPNFARVGQAFEGFSFESPENLIPGSTIEADAEYIGDPRGGKFQLTQVRVE